MNIRPSRPSCRRRRHGHVRSRGGRARLRRHQRHGDFCLQNDDEGGARAAWRQHLAAARHAPGAPSLSASGTGATLPAATYWSSSSA